jgi:hypothetical protein
MKVVIDSIGLSIPKTGIGLNVLSGSYIGIRNSKRIPQVLLGFTDCYSIGSGSETIAMGHVATDWFIVDPVKHN